MDKVPCHLAIIMDGNRRWAKERGLPGFEGHRKGAEKIRQLVKWCKARGIKTVTLYAFSTENWNRSPEEVNFLMKLFGIFLAKESKELQRNKVRLRVIGQRERLSVSLQEKIKKAEDLTKDCEEGTLVLAVSYGGRDEIVRAVKKAFLLNGVVLDRLTEEKLEDCLDTAGLPDPDLIIRTSGEQRTSGFLLWQSVYSELYFTGKYWPDFSEKDLDEALAEYAKRQRRFGK